MFKKDDTIIIQDNVFENSDDTDDFRFGGKVGTIIRELGNDCFEVYVPELDEKVLLIADEMRAYDWTDKYTLLVRVELFDEWRVISNPRFDLPLQEGLAARMLKNTFNEYVEYKNAGSIYRVIRKKVT